LVEKQGMQNIFFERGSWVSKVSPRVKTKISWRVSQNRKVWLNLCGCTRFSNWMSTSSSETELVQSWGLGHSGWIPQPKIKA
jgi:hypothetical protein